MGFEFRVVKYLWVFGADFDGCVCVCVVCGL